MSRSLQQMADNNFDLKQLYTERMTLGIQTLLTEVSNLQAIHSELNSL